MNCTGRSRVQTRSAILFGIGEGMRVSHGHKDYPSLEAGVLVSGGLGAIGERTPSPPVSFRTSKFQQVHLQSFRRSICDRVTSLHILASYIVRPMKVLRLMEDLLAIEAETKFLLRASDRSYEQTLMKELLRIFSEAELLFGPRDASYQLSIPRITECASSRTYIFRPLRMTRIYLSRQSRTKPWLASLELAHEAIHVLSPATFGCAPTILEEGLAECFAQRYVSRIHGMSFERGSNPKADAVMQAVSMLLDKNESVIRHLRTRQPVISKIDEKLLVEVAGIELSQAKFLCSDFLSYWRTPSPWSGFAAQGAERLAACLRSIWN
jgi:hypothetical protein